jgi:hypothetical protein
MYPAPSHRKSATVVVAAPMSFAGSAQRIWLLARGRAGWALAGLGTLAVLLIVIAWAAVLCWYLLFGLLLVPYRLVRRGQRKQKLAQLRHEETLRAIGQPPYGRY